MALDVDSNCHSALGLEWGGVGHPSGQCGIGMARREPPVKFEDWRRIAQFLIGIVIPHWICWNYTQINYFKFHPISIPLQSWSRWRGVVDVGEGCSGVA